MSSRNKGFLLAAVLVVLVAAAPLISALAAGGIASTLGCELNEGDVHPCLFHGIDLGDMLYGMFVLGWLTLATLPLGAIGLATLIVAWIIVAISDKRRRSLHRI